MSEETQECGSNTFTLTPSDHAFLTVLSTQSPSQVGAILRTLNKGQLKLISVLYKNILAGSFDLQEGVFRGLKKHSDVIRFIGEKANSASARHSLIVEHQKLTTTIINIALPYLEVASD